MNTDQTISAFVTFFRNRGHQPIGSSSLLSGQGDPVLFTSAGMREGDIAVRYASGGAGLLLTLVYLSVIETVLLAFLVPGRSSARSHSPSTYGARRTPHHRTPHR